MENEVLVKPRRAMISGGYDALFVLSQDKVTYTAGFLVPSPASNRFCRTITVLAGAMRREPNRGPEARLHSWEVI